MTSVARKHDVFQAIADPTRRQVLQMLAEKDLPISKITAQFPVSRTAIVKHLQILTEAQLINGQKVGREKIYRLQTESFNELKQWLSYFDQFWDNKLSMLKYSVENNDENKEGNLKEAD
ncbi:metalloregulator ArsR/SmtB family transcription factor [Planococcus sp. N028]|uniref:Metalloregulator ArsR/SmtB family transcription factor n=1 Tax=Planococcus shixiaomingii TaxID=3058393 RepID=A0ABT8N659_9BACL|nr:metalloregulator ArsR/SmtB family transcription factor [Planococcus sp. N028]MDN7243374.1 metalloregulator ArsR/SmtB family transcription factor [Planococcus sp. N028]